MNLEKNKKLKKLKERKIMRSNFDLIEKLKEAENTDLHPNIASFKRDRILAEILLDIRSLMSDISQKLDKKGK